MLIDDTPEYDLVWDKVYEILKFTPSIDKSITPFEIKEEYAIYSFDFNEIAENRIDLEEVIGNVFGKTIIGIGAGDIMHIFHPLFRMETIISLLKRILDLDI